MADSQAFRTQYRPQSTAATVQQPTLFVETAEIGINKFMTACIAEKCFPVWTWDALPSCSNSNLGHHMEPSSIRDLRRRLGWTQIDLAEALNVDQGTVSRWERGVDMPRPARLAALRDILVREDGDLARRRFQTRLRHSLQPAVFANERAQLQFFNRVAAKRYRDAYRLDLKAHIGFEFQRHSAILSAEQSWQEFVRSGFLRGDLLLARFYFNADGAGHVTEYEPFFDGGKLSGFGATVVGALSFPATQGFSVERVEAVRLNEPDRIVDLHRGRWANFARLS